MNFGLKLFFDECVSPKLMRDLDGYLKRAKIESKEMKHIMEVFQQGTKDSEWLASISPNWIVITGDAGKKGGDKLPYICLERGITHLVFWKTLQTAPSNIKWQAISSVAHQLHLLYELPKGTQVRLSKEAHKRGIVKYVLKIGARSLESYLESMTESEAVSNAGNMAQPKETQGELF